MWESQNPLTLGCLWLLPLFLSVGKNNNYVGVGCRYCVCVCQTDSCLYQDWLIPWLKKRKSKACENLFVMSIRVSHLCCNSSVSLCCSLWGKQEGLRWGGLSFSFPSVAYTFLLCIKLPLKSVKDLHLRKRY